MRHIILFDGPCILCNRLVLFIINHDTNDLFKFASLQSNYGQTLIQQHQLNTFSFDSLVYIEDNTVYLNSTACLHIAKHLNCGLSFFYYLIYIPQFIRDGVYSLVAAYRYRLFGKNDHCMVPETHLQDRFIDI